jgi:hypothetical protein
MASDMKNLKQLIVVALAVVAVCGAVGVVIMKRKAKRTAAVAPVAALHETGLAQPPAPPMEALPAVEEAPRPVEPAPPPKAVKNTGELPPAVVPANQGQGQADPPPQDVLAREALTFVGMDLQATTYWVAAINDPDLPAEERKNLIEDLNEDGLPDPRFPTMEDLPLIMSRLRLIEQLVPDAMDQDNLDAFAEAYKDLTNLAALTTGGGEPVR